MATKIFAFTLIIPLLILIGGAIFIAVHALHDAYKELSKSKKGWED